MSGDGCALETIPSHSHKPLGADLHCAEPEMKLPSSLPSSGPQGSRVNSLFEGRMEAVL